MCSLSACSLFNQNTNDNSDNDSNVSEDSNENENNEDEDTDETEDEDNEDEDSSKPKSIDDVCEYMQNLYDDSNIDATVEHGTDDEGNDTMEIYYNSGISQQEIQDEKNEIGAQNYIDTTKTSLDENESFQDIMTPEDIKNFEETFTDCGINAYIVFHLTCSDDSSVDVAVYTTSTGWQVF